MVCLLGQQRLARTKTGAAVRTVRVKRMHHTVRAHGTLLDPKVPRLLVRGWPPIVTADDYGKHTTLAYMRERWPSSSTAVYRTEPQRC